LLPSDQQKKAYRLLPFAIFADFSLRSLRLRASCRRRKDFNRKVRGELPQSSRRKAKSAAATINLPTAALCDLCGFFFAFFAVKGFLP
jgi:hypothetical protein